jgi:hypothetical protein
LRAVSEDYVPWFFPWLYKQRDIYYPCLGDWGAVLTHFLGAIGGPPVAAFVPVLLVLVVFTAKEKLFPPALGVKGAVYRTTANFCETWWLLTAFLALVYFLRTSIHELKSPELDPLQVAADFFGSIIGFLVVFALRTQFPKTR